MWEVGDIVVVRSKSLVGRVIRFITKSWASHVAVFVGDGMLFEAKPSRSGYVPVLNYATPTHDWRIYRLRVPEVQKQRFVACLVKKNNRRYDFLQIGYLAVISLLGLRKKVSIKTGANRSICSEVIFEALQEAGVEWKEWKQSNVVPGDFERWHLLERIH